MGRRIHYLRQAGMGLVLAALALAPSLAPAQAYPQRAVKMVVPFPPGGLNDVVARALAQKLQDAWGQGVVVENRAGGSTVIGSELVARAAPDGYTLLVTSAAHAINKGFFRKLPYDTVTSFTPVMLIATSPFILVVKNELPARTVAEFIALAKARPGALTYSSTGTGGSSHLMGEMLAHQAGINILHVPYKGMAPALTDLISGQVDFTFGSYSSVGPYLKGGRMRAVAVSSAKRIGVMPALPAIAEAGFPDYDANPWWGLVGPAGMPPAIVNRIHTDAVRSLRAQDVAERFRDAGVEVVASTPAEYAAHLDRDVARWEQVMRSAGMKPE